MKALLLLVAGIVGLIETALPRAAVRVWTLAVYRDAGDAEPREWVYTAVRIEGVMLVFAALVGLFRTVTAADSGETEAEETVETTARSSE